MSFTQKFCIFLETKSGIATLFSNKSLNNFLKNSHPRTFSHCFQRRKGEGEKHGCEKRSIGQLPPRCICTQDCSCPNRGIKPTTEVCALTTINPQPFVHETMLQPTEPHWPGLNINFLGINQHCQLAYSCERKPSPYRGFTKYVYKIPI